MKILSARYVLPVTSEPIDEGAVAIDGDRIAGVGPAADICARFPEAEVEFLGDAALLPGFVNCHSHLELTAMRGFLDRFDDDFSAWLLTLTKVRGERLTDADVFAGALLGAAEGARAGVTTFGDIGRLGAHGLGALKAVGLRGIVYQETMFSPDDKTADGDFASLIEKYLALKESETPLVRAAISPHSPYTVGPKLLSLIADYALENGVPLSIHAAESLMEEELLVNGTGYFTNVYEKFGVTWESPGCTTIEYLERLGVLRAKPLLAHCVRVSEDDLARIAESGASIAHCPKSNAKFGHGAAPFARFLDAGIATGLGSDSVASNNSCDMIEESRFAVLAARNRGDDFIAARSMIETATIGGARAMGLDAVVGSLDEGKQADLVAVSLADASVLPVHDPHTAIAFAANARDVRLTIVAGHEIYRDGELKSIDEGEVKAQARALAEKMK